jgi:hypothetical protein
MTVTLNEGLRRRRGLSRNKHLTREYAAGLRREPQIDHSIQGFESGSIKQKSAGTPFSKRARPPE